VLPQSREASDGPRSNWLRENGQLRLMVELNLPGNVYLGVYLYRYDVARYDQVFPETSLCRPTDRDISRLRQTFTRGRSRASSRSSLALGVAVGIEIAAWPTRPGCCALLVMKQQ